MRESLPSSAGPGSLHLPCPSLPEASRQSGGGGAPVGPTVGMVPRGDGVGVRDSRPRPRDGQGCAGAVLLLLVKMSLTPGCPPALAAPYPLWRGRDGRGAAQSDGGTARTRCTRCISSGFPGKQNKTKQNPQTQANKTPNPPQPQNTKYKQKPAFSFKLQFSVGCPCQPGRSAARRDRGSGCPQWTGRMLVLSLLALRKVPRGGLRAPSRLLPRPL